VALVEIGELVGERKFTIECARTYLLESASLDVTGLQ
jgi:hypothetical protein